MNILITGASGFIGSFLCEEALMRKMNVWAGMRERSSRKWLQNEMLHFVTLDMTDREALTGQLAAHKEKHGKWDVIIHAAGATKCLNPADFDKHNYQCTYNLVETLRQLDMVPRQFVYVSSLSVLGPIREEQVESHAIEVPQGADRAFVDKYTVGHSIYRQMTSHDAPQPNTAYGESKVKSEEWLRGLATAFPTVIFRPTGVYGPREKDYYLMAKTIKGHVDFAVGYKRQEITFVYVRDLVGAIFAAIDKQVTGRTYMMSDGYVYTSRAFSDLIQRELGVKGVMHITAPLWLLRLISTVSEAISKATGKASTLNGDKYKIMRQRNWRCDISPVIDELGYTPEWNLERGVTETINWYKREGWL